MSEIESILRLPRNTDLHTHSIYSDGQLSVGMLLKKALEKGIKYISITDHENTSQFNEFLGISRYLNLEIEVLPGLEISTSFGGQDIHLVVYFSFSNLNEVKEIVEPIKEEKVKKIHMIAKMMVDNGIYVDRYILQNGKRTLNKMYIARYIYNNSDFGSVEEVFEKYFGKGSEFDIKSDLPQTDEIIKRFSQLGCFVGVAHPEFLKDWAKVEYIKHFLRLGLKGIEVIHPIICTDLRDKIIEFALSNDLVFLGGSDFHGYDTKRNELGAFNVFDESFFKIKKFING